MYSYQQDLLGLANSNFTSPAIMVADFRDLSLSILTSTTSASNFTVQLTNVNGFDSAISEGAWSTATVITASGMQTMDPGARWMRVIRPNIAVSAASNATVSLQGKALS